MRKLRGSPRLRRLLGTRAGVLAILAGMRARFVPEAAGGFTGVIVFVLAGARGSSRRYALEVADGGARRVGERVQGREPAALTLRLTAADFAALALGEVDPMYLLLSGRLELQGDMAVAMRLGPMFGR